MKIYPAVFHYEDNGYWVEFPDLEGCFTQADTLEEAVSEAATALGSHLCSMMDRNVDIPEASDIHSITCESDSDFVSLVAADPLAFKARTKAIKKTLTIPQWLNEEAEAHNINFSKVLQNALIAMLQ